MQTRRAPLLALQRVLDAVRHGVYISHSLHAVRSHLAKWRRVLRDHARRTFHPLPLASLSPSNLVVREPPTIVSEFVGSTLKRERRGNLPPFSCNIILQTLDAGAPRSPFEREPAEVSG
jgi:hypothetical protein